MLNPSTADANTDDPTIRKCIGFAKRLGFGGIEIFNLFAFRATDPKDLRNHGYQVGADNDNIMLERLHDLGLQAEDYVILAWGANARNLQRSKDVIWSLLARNIKLRALALLKDGTPAHPLMLPYSSQTVYLTGDSL